MTSAKIEATINAPIDPPLLTGGTQVIRSEGWYQMVNPLLKETSANEVFLSHVKDSEVEKKVETTLEIYKKHHLPFKWSIGPMSSPDRLEKVIAPLASTNWEFRGMVIDTAVALLPSSGFKTELVTRKNFSQFLEINLEGWELRPFKDSTQVKLQRMVDHPLYRFFIVRKEDQVIGSAGTVLKDGYGFLIAAVVLKEFRGCGAYRRLTQARLTDLKNLKFDFAVTQARENTSAPVLEKLGFETVYRAKIYRFDFTDAR